MEARKEGREEGRKELGKEGSDRGREGGREGGRWRVGGPTAESTKPVRIPPRRVPAHYKSEVSRQINEMLQQGIISESSSPWLAPCVFVPKSNGELQICVDLLDTKA